MILTLSRLISASKFSVHTVRYYRLPPNLTSFLDDYSQEYKKNQNTTVIESYKSIKSKVSEYEELRSFIGTSTDKELVEIAELDLESISEFIDNEVNVIKEELIVPEKYDAENAMMEVVPGAGGQEASLFAEQIFNFYISFCQDHGCDIEIVEVTKNSLNKSSKAVTSSGITKGVVRILSDNAPVFKLMKFESGVHRVQRVPVTGTKNDRLQTSTCSVAVLPEPRNVTVELRDRDLKWEYMRASGAGGQGVNTADSAVRLTHLPTNTVVESQEERAQAQNKKRARAKLQAILYQREWEEDQRRVSSSRKLQIGNMNRNEKIRTYNFNRHMISDHRVNKSETFPNISQWFAGQYGFEFINNTRELLEEEDKSDQFLRLMSDFSYDIPSKKS